MHQHVNHYNWIGYEISNTLVSPTFIYFLECSMFAECWTDPLVFYIFLVVLCMVRVQVVEPIFLLNGSLRRPFFGDSSCNVILMSAGPRHQLRLETPACSCRWRCVAMWLSPACRLASIGLCQTCALLHWCRICAFHLFSFWNSVKT